MSHLLVFILGVLGPAVVFALSPRLALLPRALLWLLGVPCHCMGALALLLPLPCGSGTLPACLAGIGVMALYAALVKPLGADTRPLFTPVALVREIGFTAALTGLS